MQEFSTGQIVRVVADEECGPVFNGRPLADVSGLFRLSYVWKKFGRTYADACEVSYVDGREVRGACHTFFLAGRPYRVGSLFLRPYRVSIQEGN